MFVFGIFRHRKGCILVHGHITPGYYAAAVRTWFDRDPGLRLGTGAPRRGYPKDFLLKRIMECLPQMIEDLFLRKTMENQLSGEGRATTSERHED